MQDLNDGPSLKKEEAWDDSAIYITFFTRKA